MEAYAMKAFASSAPHRRRSSIARLACAALGVSLLAPVACGDDDDSAAPPGGGDQAGEGGQSTPSGGSSAGKPSAGSHNGGSNNSGSSGGGNAQGGSANTGGDAQAGAPAGGMSSSTGGVGDSGGQDTGSLGGAASPADGGMSGSGGEPATCNDVLDNPGCADADPATVDGQSAAFGGCVHINQVSPGHGWVAYQSFGVDIASGLSFVQTAQIKNHDEIAAACAAMTVQGVSGWRLPTIDEARLLAGGCEPTAPGGSCLLSDPDCLSSSCGFASPDCESCFGGQGPHKSKGYCRPEVPFCLNAATSSACADCATVGFWTYGIINGNFYSAKSTDQMFVICVKEDVPRALPCSL
jgi:hypothetical protein